MKQRIAGAGAGAAEASAAAAAQQLGVREGDDGVPRRLVPADRGAGGGGVQAQRRGLEGLDGAPPDRPPRDAAVLERGPADQGHQQGVQEDVELQPIGRDRTWKR